MHRRIVSFNMFIIFLKNKFLNIHLKYICPAHKAIIQYIIFFGRLSKVLKPISCLMQKVLSDLKMLWFETFSLFLRSHGCQVSLGVEELKLLGVNQV